MIDRTHATDQLAAVAGYSRPLRDLTVIRGTIIAELRGPDGRLKVRSVTRNLITQQGDQDYADAFAALSANATVSAPSAPTGLQLGTGSTAPAKTGAGAAIVTYVSGSDKAIDGAFPTSSLNGSARRITWQAAWAAGEATSDGIVECALVTRTLDGSVATAAQTVARGLLSPVVNKGADDTLTVTWHHDHEGT